MKRIALAVLLLLLAVPLLAWYWLLHTESGARQVGRLAVGQIAGLELSEPGGDLDSGLQLAEIRFATDDVVVIARKVALEVEVGLLPFSLTVPALRVAELSIEPRRRAAGDAADAGVPDFAGLAEGLRLPFRLTIGRAEVASLRYAGTSPVEVSALAFSLQWDDVLDVRALHGRLGDVVVDADVRLQLADAGRATVELAAASEQGRIVARLGGVPTDYTLEGKGDLDLPGLGATHVELQGDGDLDTLRLTSLALDSEPLRLDGSGEWQWTGEWRYAGTAIVAARDEVPGGSFELTARGDRQQATASIAEGRVLGGRIAGEVEYAWQDAAPWRADLSFADVDTGFFSADWPGEVSGKLVAHGSRSPQAVVVESLDVEGHLRGKPLLATGGLRRDAQTTRADALEIRHGSARLRLDGALDRQGGLLFELAIPALEAYVPGAEGDVHASGSLGWRGDLPLLTATAESAALSFGRVALRDVEIDSRPAGDSLFAADLRAGQISFDGEAIDEVSVELDYGTPQQQATLAAHYAGMRIDAVLAGAFERWREPWASAWHGTLESLALRQPDVFELQSTGAAALEFSAQSLRLGNLCATTAADAGLCVRAQYSADAGIDVEAELEALPLAAFAQHVPGRLDFSQRVDGRLRISRSAAGVPGGEARFDVSAGRVATLDDPDTGLDTAAGTVAIELEDGALLSASVALPFADGGGIDAQFALLDVGKPKTSPVEGHARIDVPDIRVGVGLLPSLSRLRGRLVSNWRLAGTADAPDASGDLLLSDAELSYAPLGLRLTELQLDGRLSPADGLELSGSFRAGDGSGRIESTAGIADGIELRIRGERLVLVDLPEIRAVVTPDVQLAYADETLRIGGRLQVPSAQIRPADLTGGRVSESDDVVIVAGEVPAASTAGGREGKLHYEGALTLALGDDVIVDLDPARARLGGEVEFAWSGDAMPAGRGRLTLGGKVAAFGQVLDITDGQIRFNGGPANNPGLRIRAEREIYGNSDVKTAGVLIDGPAGNPTIEAYTQPASNEERALTLLVTGSDFDYEQGVGALDFGTYIAPRLFVSYGVGIFDRDNVISARYDLARGFGIKMSSGDKASGVDLSYRFER